MTVGGVVAFVAAALLAREGYLPESFADWDDEVANKNHSSMFLSFSLNLFIKTIHRPWSPMTAIDGSTLNEQYVLL